MKNKVLFIFIVLFNFGCISKTAQKEKSTRIQPENAFFSISIPESIKKEREVLLSEIADTIEYIPLETSQNSLLGSIKDLKMTKDYIFIETWKGPLAQFNRSGKFIRYVGSFGRGPEEYVSIREFSIDEEQKKIYIHSGYNRSILVYSFNGDYLNTIRFPEDFGNIVWSRDSLLMCFHEPTRGVEKYVFEERNSKAEILQSVKNNFFWQNSSKYSYMTAYTQRTVYYRLNNRLHFKGWYNDTVFSYDNNSKIVPKYFIDLGKLRLPDDLRVEVTSKTPTSTEFYWVSAKESIRYIFLFYCTYSSSERRPGAPTDFGFIYFDKKKQESTRCKRNLFFNDIDGGPNFYPEYVNDSIAIGYETASQLIKYFGTNYQPNSIPKKQELKQILKMKFKGLDEGDNPIITIVKLKSRN